jgi:hypothetical protein
MRARLATLLIVGLFSACDALTPTIDRIEIVETGIYRADVTHEGSAPGTAFRATGTVVNITLVQSTTRIPARIGERFGMRYRVVGEPAGAAITLKIVVLVPEPGLRSATTGVQMTRNEFSVRRRVGETNYVDIQFDDEPDLVVGEWTFEIWDGSHKFASQGFEVFKP